MKSDSYRYWLIFLILTTNASLAASDPPLNVVSALYQQIEREYIIDGVVEPVNQATIAAQTSGQVLEVNFDVDDFVKKGTLLVRIKSTEQTASLSQMKARVAEAEAYLNAAQKEYDRFKKLRAKKVVSAAKLDTALANLDAARARVKAARADVRQVSQRVDYTTIKAPYSGIVIERHIQRGEIASLGQPIMTGFSPDTLRAVVTVPQSRIDAIRQHQKARMILNVEAGDKSPTTNGAFSLVKRAKTQSFDGIKLTIAPYADAKTHTFRVRVYFPENIKAVYPGMFTKVAFVVGQARRLMIPVSAVAYRGEVRAVYIVDKQGQVSMRQVRLGRTYLDKIEILAGLEEGEQIATNPVDAAILLKTQR